MFLEVCYWYPHYGAFRPSQALPFVAFDQVREGGNQGGALLQLRVTQLRTLGQSSGSGAGQTKKVVDSCRDRVQV